VPFPSLPKKSPRRPISQRISPFVGQSQRGFVRFELQPMQSLL
jgi:hypothetical protein